MKPEIKRLHSPDIDDLVTYQPQGTDAFSFLLQIIAGPEGQDGEESFDVVVCSPAWLVQNIGNDEIVIGRHHLIMANYDYEQLVKFIRDQCAKCSGRDWEEVANKLGRLGQWEFEDYVPSKEH